MTTTNTTTTVNTIEQAANTARQIWDAAVDVERAARTSGDLDAVIAASRAERIAHDLWRNAERALVAHWSAEVAADEEARLQAMCEAHDAVEWDYADYNDGSLGEPIPYTVTDRGMTYLDRHYLTHTQVVQAAVAALSNEDGVLAAGGESPYGDGTTGWVQPTPAHPCYTNGVADMDALSRYEDLSY